MGSVVSRTCRRRDRNACRRLRVRAFRWPRHETYPAHAAGWWEGVMEPVTLIRRLFEERGADAYFGEPVSQLDHALQTAHLAAASGVSDALVVAALLHDIGHLIDSRPENIADNGIDARHEDTGVAFLSRYFGDEVVEPVRLHVAAKRYLCSVSAEYAARLSPASAQSLALQGGPMSEDEAAAF